MVLEDDDLISKDHLQELLSDPDMNLTEADIEVLHVDALFDYLLSLDASQGELVKKDVFNKALEQADTSTVVYNPNPRLLCTLAGHTDWVTQVEFIDADTVVSSSNDGTTRAGDVATGTQKAEFEGDKFSFTKSSGGDEQTVGAYVVTKKDNLVLVHQTHALKHNEPTAENSHAVAFFRAPGVVQTLECAGDRIAVGCQNGEVLHLHAPWLVDS